MLERFARPTLLFACAFNVFCAACIPFFTDGGRFPVTGNAPAMVGGTLAVVLAMTLAALLLRRRNAPGRKWIKLTLVFLALSPTAFSLLLWPNLADTICIGRACYSEAAMAIQVPAMANVWQTHAAMVLVAVVALFCATNVATATRGPVGA